MPAKELHLAAYSWDAEGRLASPPPGGSSFIAVNSRLAKPGFLATMDVVRTGCAWRWSRADAVNIASHTSREGRPVGDCSLLTCQTSDAAAILRPDVSLKKLAY